MSDELVQEICSSWPRSASNSNLSSYHPQTPSTLQDDPRDSGGRIAYFSEDFLSAYAQPAARTFSRQALVSVEATHHRLLTRSILFRELASVAARWCLPTNCTA